VSGSASRARRCSRHQGFWPALDAAASNEPTHDLEIGRLNRAVIATNRVIERLEGIRLLNGTGEITERAEAVAAAVLARLEFLQYPPYFDRDLESEARELRLLREEEQHRYEQYRQALGARLRDIAAAT
jgi:hypothetical protein